MMKILLALRVSSETLGKGFLLRPRPSVVGLVTERQKVTTKKVLKELLGYWKMRAGYIRNLNCSKNSYLYMYTIARVWVRFKSLLIL